MVHSIAAFYGEWAVKSGENSCAQGVEKWAGNLVKTEQNWGKTE
jgi:hypothetical protein